MVILPATGDVVLIPFPFADLSRSKQRPVLVLSPPDHHGDFIALAMTTRPNHPQAMPLAQDALLTGRLPKPTWIRVDKVFSLNVSLISAPAARLKDDTVQEVVRALCRLLGSVPDVSIN